MKGMGFTLFLPNGRIKFESGLGKKATSPSFGCVILEIGNWDNIIDEPNEFSDILRLKL